MSVASLRKRFKRQITSQLQVNYLQRVWRATPLGQLQFFLPGCVSMDRPILKGLNEYDSDPL